MRRSIGLPLGLGIALAILVLALAVGWQILVVGDPRPVTSGLRTADWVLLVLGLASLRVLGELRPRVDVASLARSRVVSRYAAESGVIEAQWLLEQIVRASATPEDQAHAFADFQSRIELMGPRELGSARYQVVVEDLNAKVDLNRSSELVVSGLLEQFVSRESAQALVSALATFRGARSRIEADGSGPDSGIGTLGAAAGGGRPITRLEELSRVPGFGDSLAALLAPYTTVWGDGLINVNTASLPVLAAVPEIGDAAAQFLIASRQRGRTYSSTAAVSSELTDESGGAAGSRMRDLTTTTRRVLIVSRGWEDGHPFSHEVQAVFDVITSRLVTGSRVRLRYWVERER